MVPASTTKVRKLHIVCSDEMMKSPVASPPCRILVAMRPAKSFW